MHGVPTKGVQNTELTLKTCCGYAESHNLNMDLVRKGTPGLN